MKRNPTEIPESLNRNQTINANYDVVAEAEAILAEAALATV